MTDSERVRRADIEPAEGGVDEAMPTTGLLWGVGAVSRRTGIAAPTLRTWDRRYGLGPSVRTGGGHRRYTEVDVQRVDTVRRLIDAGVPAQEAAALLRGRDQTEIVAILERTPTVVDLEPAWPSRSFAIDSIVQACERLEGHRLGRTYSEVLQSQGIEQAWTEVLAPAMIEIGRLWEQGEVGVAAEHVASERLAAELRALTRARRLRGSDPARVILAAAEDEEHTLPLLALEAALADRRISCLTLGGRTPGPSLAQAVRRIEPRVVFVWASMPQGGHGERLAEQLPQTQVVVGGPGWAGGQVEPQPSTVQRVDDLAGTVKLISDTLAG